MVSGNYCTCLSAYSSFNEQDSHPMSTSSCGYGSRYTTQSKQESENSTDFKAGEVDNFGDETSTDFLTIGTLASEWAIGEPVTPRFTMFLENITEGKTEVTENDLKVINDELEKFLGPEAEEHASHESSGRNSLVSTIAVNGEPTQEVSAEEYGKAIVCPLQGYLFGSSIELPETRFQVTRLFHRKIHPESSIAERESKVQHKNEMNNTPYNDGDSTDGEQMHQVEVKNWFSQGSTSRAGTQNYKSFSVMPQPQYGVTGCIAASSNGAHWIKTEADSI
ncbi:hypothetical protein J1N35_038694 [Gossypium stocksii]|uniref:Uncharacterized protein n=1 Tax=Gossypium stocksii TaxID=47602 RepID=A0A9D3UMZ1_9ROSI|nr:hypothetical protein J1N35_038694 [Gossypium stocksii]